VFPVGGVGRSYPSQKKIRVVFLVGTEGDTDSEVAMIMCGAVGAMEGRGASEFPRIKRWK
jgi:hypothetical protein